MYFGERKMNFTKFHNQALKDGAAAQEKSKKEYLKLSPKEKARHGRMEKIIFGGDYICPHCKKDILEAK